MVYSLNYRRPSRVSSSRSSQLSLSGDEKQRSIEESVRSGTSSCISHGIPEALSFDRVIAGGTCPPCTTRDFMNYLKYIEHAAENLQFFLWYRSYCSRWDKLSSTERSLAPEWTRTQAETEAAAAKAHSRVNPAVAAILKGTDFEEGCGEPITEKVDPFHTPPKHSVEKHSVEEKVDFIDYDTVSTSDGKSSTIARSHENIADQAFDDAGLKWKPFAAQPYRNEVTRIISIYIAEGAPRELNLSSRERTAVLHALQNTTHPSAFRLVVATAEYSLRKQAHPNFIRWTICNGNRTRVIFARGLGIGGIVAGLIADLLITLSSAGRGYRVIPFIAWFIGISTLIAAWKGMCVVLHGMHHRHLRPWELFADEDESTHSTDLLLSSDSLLSTSSNSYEDEPWVAKYSGRNFIRKIFDREIWVQEPALRQIQDTIFIQALLGSFVLSAIAVGIFCAVPRGNFF